MGLPIAIGGKALSSRAVCPPQPIPEDGSDGSVLEPCLVECPPRLATAVSHDHTLSATCSISYYEMMKIGKKKDAAPKRECFMAEIRLQISPLSQAYSTTYRDTLHRIPFPNQKEHDENELVQSLFLSLRLLSLLPTDEILPVWFLIQDKSSMLVIFQLRKPRTTPAVNLPRPSYLGTAPTLPLIRVATNPQVTKLPNDTPLRKASTICNIHTQSRGSLLLAGCVDGSIVVIAYRPAQVAGILHSVRRCYVNLSHRTNTPVEHMRWFERKTRGNRQNGTAILFSSHLVISETSNMLLMQLQKRLRVVWIKVFCESCMDGTGIFGTTGETVGTIFGCSSSVAHSQGRRRWTFRACGDAHHVNGTFEWICTRFFFLGKCCSTRNEYWCQLSSGNIGNGNLSRIWQGVRLFGCIVFCHGSAWIGQTLCMYMALANQRRWTHVDDTFATSLVGTRQCCHMASSHLFRIVFCLRLSMVESYLHTFCQIVHGIGKVNIKTEYERKFTILLFFHLQKPWMDQDVNNHHR